MRTKMSENQFQNILIEHFKNNGGLILNIHGHLMQKSGWPDLYVSHPEWRGWIELKVEGRKLTTLQRIVIKDLIKRETNAFTMTLKFKGEMVIEATDSEDALLSRIAFSNWRDSKPWNYLQHISRLLDIK